jgi:hypothetical protein
MTNLVVFSRALLVCVLASTHLLCQVTNNSFTTAASQVPLRVLYRHFLAYQNHLDRAASILDKSGKNGDALRSHFQKKLGFTDIQFQLVRASALRLEIALKDQDAKAKALIDATRADAPNVISNPADLPPIPPELIEMQRQRDALINQEITHLKQSLGTNAAAKLDALLMYDFARSVTVQSIGPPRPQDPVTHPIAPFPPETQQ